MATLQLPHREKQSNGVTAPTTKAVILVSWAIKDA